MMKSAFILYLLIFFQYHLLAQITLIREGIVINNTLTGTWYGDAIPRSVPTTLTYRNNSITSVNFDGYMLQAGDEVVGSTNNNLDGEIITGNKFIWNGINMTSITHGIFSGHNINAVIKYNYLEKIPMAIIRKSNGMTNTVGGVAYNIVRNPNVGIVVKGMNNVNIYNNTLYSERTTSDTYRGLIDIYTNTDVTPNGSSTGSKIYNNIFYTKHQIANIFVYDNNSLAGFESDYNVFYCEDGTPMFKYLGIFKTFAQWQALGYDTHSRVVNPNFTSFTTLVPSARLDFGTDLGAEWQTGLSTTAQWIVGTSPATANQNGTWQVGASLYLRVSVSGISVNGAGGENTITTDNGSLQLSAGITPDDATDKTVTWSIANGVGLATITSTGLVTAIANGNVAVRATANDGSGIIGEFQITISNQITLVEGITLSSASGTSITTDKGALQLQANVLPTDATTKTVNWSVINETGKASISTSGLITAAKNGTVIAVASANDGSGIKGELQVTISNQIILIESIILSSPTGTSITTDKGTLQLQAAILPTDATTKTVSWSVINETGKASISTSGLITAEKNGTVMAIASANDGSGIKGELQIAISNQTILVENISIIDTLANDTIKGIDTKLTLNAVINPANATNQSISWLVENLTGKATIDANGLLTTISQGTINVVAKANDGSQSFSQKQYVIAIPVTAFDLLHQDNFRIFPNPTLDKIQIQTGKMPSGGIVVKIMNINGQILEKKRVFESVTEWSVAQYSSDVLLINVTDDRGSITKKVIVVSKLK